jgi:sortase A
VVLAAHDVTWFSQIDNLEPRSRIDIVAPCSTYEYTVTDHRIITTATPIYVSNTPSLVLITCYPLDALFLTPQRYIVNATLTSVKEKGSQPGLPQSPAIPTVPAPLALSRQGLDLAHNPAPMGSLTVTGQASAAWLQSTAPLGFGNAVVELYFAALRSAEQGQQGWWADLAPGVPWSTTASLFGGVVTHNNITLSPQITVVGSQFVSATLTAKPTVRIQGVSHVYQVTLNASVSNGNLLVTAWSVSRY